ADVGGGWVGVAAARPHAVAGERQFSWVASAARDRDRLFTDVLAAAGGECIRLPARSPDLDFVAERFVLSIKSECLSKLVPARCHAAIGDRPAAETAIDSPTASASRPRAA